jgi:hypothetical protein
MHKFTVKPLENGKYAILEDGKYCFYNTEPFTCNKTDVPEIMRLLNGGVPVSEFFADGGDDYYGSPSHAENGDAWFYAGCEGAW